MGDQDYDLFGGLRIVHTPFIIFNNHSPVTLGTNDMSYTVPLTGGNLSIRTSLNSNLVQGYGVYSTQGIGDAMTTAGVSMPAIISPSELSVNFQVQLSSPKFPITIGDTFTAQARWSPPGAAVLVALLTIYVPEISIPVLYTTCRARAVCP